MKEIIRLISENSLILKDVSRLKDPEHLAKWIMGAGSKQTETCHCEISGHWRQSYKHLEKNNSKIKNLDSVAPDIVTDVTQEA